MIGYLYRYPHPQDSTRFIYVGQETNPLRPRDIVHRRGRVCFGRRFKIKFPNTVLPQPIKEQVIVRNQLELNELETIWMFQYHTWCGYPDGMNIQIPNAEDYKNASRQAYLSTTPQQRSDHSRKGGLKNVESGHLQRLNAMFASENGRKGSASCKRLGLGMFAMTFEQKSARGKKGGLTNVRTGHIQNLGRVQGLKNVDNLRRISHLGVHNRLHIKRGMPNIRCALCSEQSLIIAFA